MMKANSRLEDSYAGDDYFNDFNDFKDDDFNDDDIDADFNDDDFNDDIDARNLPTRWPLPSDASMKSFLSEVNRVHIRSEHK